MFNRRTPRKGVAVFLIVSVLSTLFYVACETDDHGLDVNAFALITGDLALNSVVPDTTDELILALMGDNLSLASTASISKRSLNLSQSVTSQTVDFEMDAELGNYDALFVIWKQKGTPLSRPGESLSLLENVVGSYCDDGALIPLDITKENSLLEDVRVNADLTKVNRTARVSGTIVFQGGAAGWPTDIDNIAIATVNTEGINILEAYAKLTGTIDVCFLLERLDIHFLPKNPVDSYDFTYDVAPGGTILVLAGNKTGQSLFQPTILIDIGNILEYEGAFSAIADTTIELNPITADLGNFDEGQ